MTVMIQGKMDRCLHKLARALAVVLMTDVESLLADADLNISVVA